jgi:hypothetical protein
MGGEEFALREEVQKQRCWGGLSDLKNALSMRPGGRRQLVARLISERGGVARAGGRHRRRRRCIKAGARGEILRT